MLSRKPLAGTAVLRDRSPLRDSDRLASDVESLVQHIVDAALAYIVAGRDRVLIFASPMSEPDINSVIERESVCHWSRSIPRKCHCPRKRTCLFFCPRARSIKVVGADVSQDLNIR